MELLTDRYADKISGTLSCYDRVIIQGTLPGLCYADGMTGYLKAKGIRIFDYPRFAEPLRNELRDNAEQIAKDNNLEIEFIRMCGGTSLTNWTYYDMDADVILQRGETCHDKPDWMRRELCILSLSVELSVKR